jgi:hypothetical protein
VPENNNKCILEESSLVKLRRKISTVLVQRELKTKQLCLAAGYRWKRRAKLTPRDATPHTRPDSAQGFNFAFYLRLGDIAGL